jgi:hypothetical protein
MEFNAFVDEQLELRRKQAANSIEIEVLMLEVRNKRAILESFSLDSDLHG